MPIGFISAFFASRTITHRTVDKYFELFEKILITGIPMFLYMDVLYKDRTIDLLKNYPNLTIIEYMTLDTSWIPTDATLPAKRNSHKDTIDYFAIQLSKLRLLEDASTKISTLFSHLAWIDFGVFHMFRDIPRMARALQYLSAYPLESGKVWSPGCWAIGGNYELWDKPCWCHSGSLLVGDRTRFKALYEKQTNLVNQNLPKLTWEVNYWKMIGDVFTMYKGEHNDSLLLGFPIPWPKTV